MAKSSTVKGKDKAGRGIVVKISLLLVSVFFVINLLLSLAFPFIAPLYEYIAKTEISILALFIIAIMLLWKGKQLGVYIYCIAVLFYIVLPPYLKQQYSGSILWIPVSGILVYFSKKWKVFEPLNLKGDLIKILLLISIVCVAVIGWTFVSSLNVPEWKTYSNKEDNYPTDNTILFKVEIPGLWREKTSGDAEWDDVNKKYTQIASTDYNFSDGQMIYPSDPKIGISIITADSQHGAHFASIMERLREGKFSVRESGDDYNPVYGYYSPIIWKGLQGYSYCNESGMKSDRNYSCRNIQVSYEGYIIQIYDLHFGSYKSNRHDYQNILFTDAQEAEKVFNHILSSFTFLPSKPKEPQENIEKGVNKLLK
jgi:hypothetical protein